MGGGRDGYWRNHVCVDSTKETLLARVWAIVCDFLAPFMVDMRKSRVMFLLKSAPLGWLEGREWRVE